MLTTNTPKIELGSIRYGVPVSFSYRVKNESDKTINITQLLAGCSACTRASTQDSILSPGQEGLVNVTFTPGSTGVNVKKVAVAYTVGGVAHPALDLKFSANVYG